MPQNQSFSAYLKAKLIQASLGLVDKRGRTLMTLDEFCQYIHTKAQNDLLHVTPHKLSGWMNGRRTPSAHVQAYICKVLGPAPTTTGE